MSFFYFLEEICFKTYLNADVKDLCDEHSVQSDSSAEIFPSKGFIVRLIILANHLLDW